VVCVAEPAHAADRPDRRDTPLGRHSPREVEVKVHHPDGLGDVELRRPGAAGTVLVLQDGDGARLALGNDWGIQVEQSCVATLGQAAEWAPGEFSLRWEGDGLRTGLGDAR
jgi:hypothetical protein